MDVRRQQPRLHSLHDRVFVASADGSGETFLAPGSGPLTWSPDSTTVVFEECTRIPGGMLDPG
jgi:hypothetical protein